MNKRDAAAEGLTFTGIYSHNKAEVKARALAIRNAGFRARVVDVPTSKYSRGSQALGYSVYVGPGYDEAVTARREWENAPATISYADKKLAELAAEIADLQAKKAAAQILLAGVEPKAVR